MSLRIWIPAVLMLLGALAAPCLARADALDSLLARPNLDAVLYERAVLERNPTIAAARAAWRVAEAEADRAGAWDDPMVEVMTAPRSWSSSSVDPAYMVSLTQTLPIFGQRGLQGKAARATSRAVAEDYRAGRLDILREARRTYYELYFVARGQAVNAEIGDLLTQFRRSAVGKYSAGTVGLNDALQADVELAMLDHQRVALGRERRVITARINALLQREPTGALPDPPAVLALPPAPMRGDSVHALSRAMRPELRGFDEQRSAKQAELSLARRARLPELSLTARYDRFMEESEWRPQVGAGFNLPIQFGRIGAAERTAKAGIEQIEYRRLAAEADIGSQVETALAQVQETEHEIHIIRERVVPASERALQAIRASYENNRADFLTLLNAERDLARARLNLVHAEVDYMQSVADLDRAVGVAPSESMEVKR